MFPRGSNVTIEVLYRMLKCLFKTYNGKSILFLVSALCHLTLGIPPCVSGCMCVCVHVCVVPACACKCEYGVYVCVCMCVCVCVHVCVSV